MSRPLGTPATAQQATGTKDTTYALVSVLYHALQGAEMVGPYLDRIGFSFSQSWQSP
jgi:hypothetical protein